jgi:hypothetical protein
MGDEENPAFRLRTGDLASRAFEDETIVLDLRSSKYMTTNASGTLLWHKLEQGTTRRELIEVLRAAFEVDLQTAERDVDAFLADCGKRGLLE